VTVQSIKRVLDRLDEAKRRFGPGAHKQTEKLLTQLNRAVETSPASLIRFHELLLFVRAYPQSARVMELAERALKTFPVRIERLRERGADLSAFDDPEVSGIAGTSVSDTFTYYIVSWLLRAHARRIAFDWDWFDSENRLAETWPRFMPLLEEDAYVEANVPYAEWLKLASGEKHSVGWLINRFQWLPLSDKQRAELYDSQQLFVKWNPPYRATRTGMRLTARELFFHRAPLISRREISFGEELQKPSPPLERLSAKQGEAILDLAREASTIRYRELYGFTHGDAKRVLKASLGRGVEIFIMGVPPEKRLPLRAYHAAMIFKNGVPIGYFEGLSLFERMESGFNLYYTFRDGETAWLYARTLNIFHHLLGVTGFALDPYQIGYENEEGIESGAFWFYRKLGFRSTRPQLRKLTEEQEHKIKKSAAYRTSEKTLRRLAEGSMIFELDQTKTGDWDRFQVRKVGFAVQRQMAGRFHGDANSIRSASIAEVKRALGMDLTLRNLSVAEQNAVSDFSVVLALIPDLERWSKDEKSSVVRVIRAKASPIEADYLKAMQAHPRLRKELIRLGS
jgi:hypothetical protein